MLDHVTSMSTFVTCLVLRLNITMTGSDTRGVEVWLKKSGQLRGVFSG